ncbi:MAG: Holliday junction branch migration protein RuvA [Clostridia bacterium]|nr:Holliday junction branch migration protein RuvA [Clostridia bacterium]
MIDFIEGIVADKTPGELVMNAGGVGFLLMCSAATLAEAPSVGEKWRCYSVLNVREDAMELFGFAGKQERDMFRRLCQVTGIGAKTALGVLSAMPLRDLSVAIVTGDVAALSRAPGIGKKTAQRIVLELKDKVEQADLSAAGSAPVSAAPMGNAQREAQAALQALGYTSAEAARAINLVRDQADTVDALVMLALKQVGSL